MRRHKDPGGAIDKHAPIDADAARIRPQQSGDRVHHRGLARARAPEQRRHAPRRLERHIQREAVKLVAQRYRYRHAPDIRRATRVPTHSASNSAAIATTTEIATNRSAAPSAPGCCRKE
ncbi:hypothetical protein GALL_540400 [mine drainage metagenome]|uniref:Uncharacterized protein n=1 Tax=mine drainage metagenome TaxID=410659 RepID=A0A1J5NYR6_9ZZZZ